MHILITGGAGFISSHIVDKLVARADKVTVLDNLHPQVHPNSEIPSYLNKNIEFILGDVRDMAACQKALHGVDAVIFNAAAVGVGQSMYEINNYIDINCRGAAIFWEALLDAKKQENFKVKKIIIAASMSAYGEGTYVDSAAKITKPVERTQADLADKNWEMRSAAGEILKPIPTPETKPLEPTSIYAISKRDQEEMFLTLGKTYGIPTIAFRYFNVIGSRQALSNPYTGVAAIFCSRILNNNQPLVFEDGEQLRDFVHVSDVAAANLLALDNHNIQSDVFNIGSGAPISVINLGREIAKALDSKFEPKILNQARAGDIRHCFADITKAQKILGYQPKVSIGESVKEVSQWIISGNGAAGANDKVDNCFAELQKLNLVK